MKVALHTAQRPNDVLTMTPLGIGYIYSYLKQRIHSKKVDVKIVLNLDEALEYRPDIMGIGAVSHVISEATEFARQCKDSLGCLTVLGGYHITTLPQSLPKDIWDKRQTGIPSFVISYGVNEFSYIDAAICEGSAKSAIWCGGFRRNDMMQRLVRFATANDSWQVDVVTRKIHDQSIKAGYGSIHKPYADFSTSESEPLFEEVVKIITGEMPVNMRYLGKCEGKNHLVLGSHSVGLDFSRFPMQTHDNTKIMDYLRSGLVVICDSGTPSYRFVEETGHGVIVAPDPSQLELRNAAQICLTKIRSKKWVADYMKSKYAWPIIAKSVVDNISTLR